MGFGGKRLVVYELRFTAAYLSSRLPRSLVDNEFDCCSKGRITLAAAASVWGRGHPAGVESSIQHLQI